MVKWFGLFSMFLITMTSNAQVRDTLKLSIIKVGKNPADTVFFFSTRIDTVALQPIKTDTSRIVQDINPQDLEETKYQIKLLGQIRVNSYYDFDGMTNTEGFIPYDIPIGEQEIEGLSSVYIGARQTRLGMEGTANTKVGRIRAYMDVDFASSTESFWRLRHAFVEWGYFKIGQTWSTFMDNASLPNTVDFEGPNSAMSKRHGLIRYERKYGEQHIAGFSVETPHSDYYNPADTLIQNKNKQSDFDLAARYKFFEKWGHFQIAGIYRRIYYLHSDNMEKMNGWGLLASSIFNLNKKSTLYAQYSYGKGIANYYVGFSSKQLDAVHDPIADDMLLKTIQGGYFTYNYKIRQNMTVSATAGISYIDYYDFEPLDSFWSSRYLALTYFYEPIETISLGAEITSGSRINIDKQTGNATRISVLGSFSF
jgi:hypothetical protein